MSLALAVAIGALFATGTWMVLQRTLTRVVLGLVLLSHGVNLLLLFAGGPPGAPPFVGTSDEPFSDSLAQAMVLTAIVISFGLTVFLLALAYRSWILTGHDEVIDDLEDRRVAHLEELARADIEPRGDYDDRLPSEFPGDQAAPDGGGS